MLIFSDIKMVQHWIKQYKDTYVWGLNYLKSYVNQYQPPSFLIALEAFCEKKTSG